MCAYSCDFRLDGTEIMSVLNTLGRREIGSRAEGQENSVFYRWSSRVPWFRILSISSWLPRRGVNSILLINVSYGTYNTNVNYGKRSNTFMFQCVYGRILFIRTCRRINRLYSYVVIEVHSDQFSSLFIIFVRIMGGRVQISEFNQQKFN